MQIAGKLKKAFLVMLPYISDRMVRDTLVENATVCIIWLRS